MTVPSSWLYRPHGCTISMTVPSSWLYHPHGCTVSMTVPFQWGRETDSPAEGGTAGPTVIPALPGHQAWGFAAGVSQTAGQVHQAGVMSSQQEEQPQWKHRHAYQVSISLFSSQLSAVLLKLPTHLYSGGVFRLIGLVGEGQLLMVFCLAWCPPQYWRKPFIFAAVVLLLRLTVCKFSSTPNKPQVGMTVNVLCVACFQQYSVWTFGRGVCGFSVTFRPLQ